MTTTTTISLPASRYADYDDCLTEAATDYIHEHPEARGWDLCPRWGDADRETIELTVPLAEIEREEERR